MKTSAITATATQSAEPTKKTRRRTTKEADAVKPATEAPEPQEAQAPEPETAQQPQGEPAPAEQPKLIVCKRTVNGRWYVYFKGVRPEENVGCACKTAKSAIRYMLMIKRLHSARISDEHYAELNAAAQAEAL